MTERPPTKAYLALEDRLKSSTIGEEYLSHLRSPKYLKDLQPHINQYIQEVRKLQTIVKEKVNLQLRITECEGHKIEHLFDTDLASVSTEFQNWGLGGVHENIYFINTGHQWTTIDSARFKSKHDLVANNRVLEQIKTMQHNLAELYKPIDSFCESIRNYNKTLFNLSQVFLCDELQEEKKRSDLEEELFFSKTNLIRKGVLSLSFVHSLVYQLEQSLDLSKNHPGD
jgi:hypothetical protein